VLTSPTQERQLDPRFRRMLSFGDVLDESIGLFRRHWLTFATVSAVWLIPPGLLSVLLTLSGAFNPDAIGRQFQFGRPPTLASVSDLISAAIGLYLISALFYLAWTSAVVITTDAYLHGSQPRLSSVILATLQRLPRVVLAAILYLIALFVTLLLATFVVIVYAIAFPVSLIAILASIAALVIWWLRQSWRSPWLMWLIIMTMPFGLPIYAGGSLAMYVGAAVLERRGAIAALVRSMQLVDGHWFRAVSILVVAGLIVSMLQYVPILLLQVPLLVVAATRGQIGLSQSEQAITTGAGIMCQVLFASMASIVYAVLFVDLRNRREGTDLAERVRQLEMAP
jgi:hypothetical protein